MNGGNSDGFAYNQYYIGFSWMFNPSFHVIIPLVKNAIGNANGLFSKQIVAWYPATGLFFQSIFLDRIQFPLMHVWHRWFREWRWPDCPPNRHSIAHHPPPLQQDNIKPSASILNTGPERLRFETHKYGYKFISAKERLFIKSAFIKTNCSDDPAASHPRRQ